MNNLNIIKTIHNYLWNIPLITMILLVGIILSIKLKGLQITKLKEAFFILFKKEKKDKQSISTFQAICISLSATLGAGNITGVAAAVTLGGPGALIWMIITILLGLPIKYAESYLACKYRIINDNKIIGGPYAYIENGLGEKYILLSKSYALFGMLAAILGLGTFIQINGVSDAFKNIFINDIYINNIFGTKLSISSLFIGLIFSFLTYMVILGGTKKIAKYCEILIPVVAFIYISICLFVIIFNIKYLPHTIIKIFINSFNKEAFTSGIIGYAIKEGVTKGIFTSEAGIGSSAIAISSTEEKDPKKLGLASLGSTFFGTLIICILTGIVIVITDSYNQNLSGISIANYAFITGLKINPKLVSIILFICITIFAFTTIIGWNLYGIKCLNYLTNNKYIYYIYQWIYIMMVFIGAFLNVEPIWNVAEIFNALMIIPNLLAILLLIKKIKNV